jgi:hypothetical protein
VAKELTKYKLHLKWVQELRWERGGTEPASEYTLFYGKVHETIELGTDIFWHIHRAISAVKWGELVKDGMSYIIIAGRWCDINVLNVPAPKKTIKLMMC